jgi:hypothetical protein
MVVTPGVRRRILNPIGRFFRQAVERVRPKMMTVVAIMTGLLPIMWSTGTGSEVMQRISTAHRVMRISASASSMRALIAERSATANRIFGGVTLTQTRPRRMRRTYLVLVTKLCINFRRASNSLLRSYASTTAFALPCARAASRTSNG